MIYKEFSEFVLRTPTFPLNFLEEGLVDLDSLDKRISNAAFKNTLYFASPLLCNELSKSIFHRKSDSKKSKKSINSVIKYLARISTRCTPYGLFSGCSVGQIGSETCLELDKLSKLNVRLDMEILCQIHDQIISDPELIKRLRLFVNPSLYRFGKNMRYIENSNIQKGIYTISQIDTSRLLSKVLKVCKKGIYYDDLVSLIIQEGYTYNDCLEYVNDLIANQVLIDELFYPTSGEDYLQRILRCFSQNQSPTLITLLNRVDHYIKSIKESDKDFIKNLMGIDSLIKPFQIEQPILQVDLYRDIRNCKLGHEVIKELKQLLVFLNKFIPHKKDRRIDDFAQKFFKRFDQQEIPLVMALDPDSGINYPVDFVQGYKSVLLEGIVKKEDKRKDYDFNDFLINRTLNCDLKSNRCVELTDDLVNQKDENWDDFSDTMLAMFSLVKDENGTDFLYFKGFLGDSAANLLGRFTSGSNQIFELVKKITAFEQEREPNSILAEIVHIPEARTGNIMYRAHIRDYEILSNGFTDIDPEKRIDINDILVHFKNGQLILRSKINNRNIIPRLTTAHNYHSSRSPIYKFLADYSKLAAHSISSLTNLIQVNELNSFMPRVTYKNSILSPAKWYVSTLEVRAILNKEQNDILLEISDWRIQYAIPNKVYIQYNGSEMFVDFERELSIHSVSSIFNSTDFLVFHEFFHPSDLCRSEQGSHLNEILLPFYKSHESN